MPEWNLVEEKMVVAVGTGTKGGDVVLVGALDVGGICGRIGEICGLADLASYRHVLSSFTTLCSAASPHPISPDGSTSWPESGVNDAVQL